MAGVHECSAKSQSTDKKIRRVRATPRYFPAHISQSDGKRRNPGDEVQCFEGPGTRKIGPRSPAFIIATPKVLWDSWTESKILPFKVVIVILYEYKCRQHFLILRRVTRRTRHRYVEQYLFSILRVQQCKNYMRTCLKSAERPAQSQGC